MPTVPPRIIGGRVAHKPDGKPYAYGSNPTAITSAANRGYDGIDLDHRTNAEAHGWCFHQANPTRRDGWDDPLGIVTDSTPILRMSDADCARLRYDGHTPMSVRTALLLCKAAGIIPCFEDKTFTGESVEYWAEVKAMADEIGVSFIVMSLPGTASIPGTRKLKAPHDAGAITMWLWRTGSRVPPFVDLIKSHRGRPIYRNPAGGATPPVTAPPAARPPKPSLTRWQRVRLARLERKARRGHLRRYQRRALNRLRRLRDGR